MNGQVSDVCSDCYDVLVCEQDAANLSVLVVVELGVDFYPTRLIIDLKLHHARRQQYANSHGICCAYVDGFERIGFSLWIDIDTRLEDTSSPFRGLVDVD
jgi:hypothetical protein